MEFNKGIIGIVIICLEIILNVVVDAFQKKLSKEIIIKRLIKHSVASICIVFLYFTFVYGILNRNFLYKMSQSDNEILLIIFISSMAYFYLNAIISTFFMRRLSEVNNSKISKIINSVASQMGNYSINTKKSIFMIASQIVFFSLFIKMNDFLIQPKSVVAEDTIVKLCGETFVLPSNTTIKINWKSGQPTDSGQNSNYTFISNDAIFTLPKNSKITLFEKTDLKVLKLKNNFVTYREKDKYIDNLRWNNQTTVSLNKEVPVTVEKDAKFIISKQDKILLQWSFIHSCVLCWGLMIYYAKVFFQKS